MYGNFSKHGSLITCHISEKCLVTQTILRCTETIHSSKRRHHAYYNIIKNPQVSFDLAEYTANVDAIGTLRLLEAIKTCGMENHIRFYQVTDVENVS